MTQKERMRKGLVYVSSDEEIMLEQQKCLELLYDYNQTRPGEGEKRAELNVYGNFGTTFVDDADIYVGDYVMFGPHVVVATAGHPILPSLRERAMQFNRPVRIGNNVWIGANAAVMPGVTIGDNSVIGAGSVVTKDIPANVVAVGSPCKVLREIGERDREYFYKNEKYDMTPEELLRAAEGEEKK